MSVSNADFIYVGTSNPFVIFEHVNINSGPWSKEFDEFYFTALGFASDPRAEFALANTRAAGGTTEGLIWANLGLQQLHLPSDEPQHVSGHIGLEYGNLSEVVERLQLVGVPYKTVDDPLGRCMYIETECPVGNVFRLRQQPMSDDRAQGSTSKRIMGSYLGPVRFIASTAEHALPGGLSAGLGMSYVELSVREGTAAQICAFYNHIFGCNASVVVSEETSSPMCVVNVGCRQSLRYIEVLSSTDQTKNPSSNSFPTYDGYHIAVYVNDFVEIFERLQSLHLVYENPRFPQFTYRSLEEVNCCQLVLLHWLYRLCFVFLQARCFTLIPGIMFCIL